MGTIRREGKPNRTMLPTVAEASRFNPAAIGCSFGGVNDPFNTLARSLIAAHGRKALTIAEKALADDVRSMGLDARVAEWIAVIEAIKTAQLVKPKPSKKRHRSARLRQWRPERGESAEGC
jgi:hypothetical protein